MTININNMAIANQVLSLLYTDGSRFSVKNNKLHFSWTRWSSDETTKEFQTQPKSDSYPAFNHKWGHGGTHCMALCQLARWVQGRNVYPISMWHWWLSDSVKIANPANKEKLLNLLIKNWPEKAVCIKCGQTINDSYDWFGHGKFSGCGHIKCFQEKK